MNQYSLCLVCLSVLLVILIVLYPNVQQMKYQTIKYNEEIKYMNKQIHQLSQQVAVYQYQQNYLPLNKVINIAAFSHGASIQQNETSEGYDNDQETLFQRLLTLCYIDEDCAHQTGKKSYRSNFIKGFMTIKFQQAYQIDFLIVYLQYIKISNQKQIELPLCSVQRLMIYGIKVRMEYLLVDLDLKNLSLDNTSLKLIPTKLMLKLYVDCGFTSKRFKKIKIEYVNNGHRDYTCHHGYSVYHNYAEERYPLPYLMGQI